MLYITTATGDQQFEQFADARETAEAHTTEFKTEVKVFGLLNLENDETVKVLAHQTSPNVVNGVKQADFRPWERIEPIPTNFVPPAIEGATLAYKRSRIQAAVYRKDDKTGWIVWTAETTYQLPNTKAACQLTTQLHKELMEAKHGAKS